MAVRKGTSSEGEAIGLLETHGLVAAMEGADAMLKAASVRLVRQERTDAALITCIVVGETAAVQAAVDAGRYAAERVGRVVSTHVIPRPSDSVRRDLGLDAAPQQSTGKAGTPLYDEMTVPELRRAARDRGDDSFSGRAISKAPRSTLLRFLRGDG